jgi:hypothetical protein
MISTELEVWLMAIFSIATVSYIFKPTNNHAYHFCEYTVIGAGMAHTIITSIDTLEKNAITPFLAGEYILAIPLLLGALVFFRLSTKYLWMSRYAMAVIIGSATGLMFPTTVKSQILENIANTVQPIWTGDLLTSLSNIYMWVVVFAVTFYFVFTRDYTKGPTGWIHKIGRWAMMFSFGASIGKTFFTRFSLAAAMMQDLLINWLGVAS